MNFLKKLFGSNKSHSLKTQSNNEINETGTVNLSPGTTVPKSGLYYCAMCKHGDSSVRDTMIEYARAKGLSSSEIKQVLAQAGISAENEIVKKKFSAGAIFNECPRHKEATGWTLEK
jgi:hypothetical protein